MNFVNKIGLMVALLIAVFVYCKLDEHRALAQEQQATGTYGEFEGIVVNYTTGNPVYMAKVKLYDSTGQLKSTVYTNSIGYYKSKVWNGIYRIEVSKVGWESKTWMWNNNWNSSRY